jgi:hypothetical protein
MVKAGSLDWSIGEALAFGSLLLEGGSTSTRTLMALVKGSSTLKEFTSGCAGKTLSEEPSPTDTTCCTTPERRARPTAR